MNNLYQIYYIGISNFLDRIRDKSIIIITLFMMYISYLFFPQNNASIYFTLNVFKNGFFYRGIYNSMWLGWISTIVFITLISLIGFYFVNNSIKREKKLKIGEISASMPVKSWIFIFGKTFGNFMFLLLQMAVVILITIIMQFVRGESYSIQIIKLLIPFLLLAIPVCIIVSVIAITFETIPFLSSSFGNVVYFFTWATLGSVSVSTINKGNSFLTDVFGMNTAGKIIQEQLKINFKDLQDMDGFNIGNSGILHNNIKTFVMDKANLEIYMFFERLFWIGIAILILSLVSIIFRRSLLLMKKSSKTIKKSKEIVKENLYKPSKRISLTPIFESKIYSNDLSIIKGELAMILKTPSIWWYALIIMISIGIILTKGETVNKVLIPIAWILPMFIWSQLGFVQRNYNMESYLFTYKNYRNSQLINSFMAGLIFTIFINIGTIIKFISINNFKGVLYIFLGSFFITAFGIFVGSATGSSTVFEIIYIILWYVGMLNGMPYLDFLGLTQKATSINIPIIFFIIGVILLILSFIVKSNRIKRLYN